MYICERCGTRFGRITASESCPRCLVRDGIRVALASGRATEERPAPRRPPRCGGLEAAVRERLREPARGPAGEESGGLQGAA